MWEIEESGNGKHLLCTQVWYLLHVHTDVYVRTREPHTDVRARAHVNPTQTCMRACTYMHTRTSAVRSELCAMFVQQQLPNNSGI